MAPKPTTLTVTQRIDLTCPACGHVGAFLATELQSLGVVNASLLGYPEDRDHQVVNTAATSASVTAKCEGCEREVRFGTCPVAFVVGASS